MMLDWTPNTNHLGIYVAKQQGWYEDAGLDVEIVEPGTAGAMALVAEGQADFGISVQESIIPARHQDVPIVAIAAIVQHNTSSLMSLAEDEIEEPGDLAGKAYGGFGGALETALIEKLTECGGGDPSAVEITEVGNVDYLVGMDRDQYDFVWIFDGWDGIRAEEIEGADVNFLRFIDYTDCIPDWYTPMLVTSEAMIEDNPEAVRAFTEATARGYEFAMENPDEAADALLEAAPELDEQLVRSSAEYLSTRFVDEGRQWGLQDEEIWTEFVDFLVEAGLIDDTIDVPSAYTNEFLPEG
jgi:ABC-type nitrate/sulfonate/bicarbonate transport system substrate-binding protein